LDFSLAAGRHAIEVKASTWFVPHRFTRSRDFRPLGWKARRVEFV